MSDSPKPKGPYVKWTNHGYEGWSFGDYPTLRAAIDAESYGSPYVICRVVDWEPAEKPQADMLEIEGH